MKLQSELNTDLLPFSVKRIGTFVYLARADRLVRKFSTYTEAQTWVSSMTGTLGKAILIAS